MMRLHPQRPPFIIVEEMEVYTANNTKVSQSSTGNVIIWQHDHHTTCILVEKDSWRDFIKMVNAVNLILKEQGAINVDSDCMPIYCVDTNTAFQLTTGDIVIKHSLGFDELDRQLVIEDRYWRDFVKAVNTANIIMKKNQVRDG